MREPHYADDAVTLYHGDCIDILAELPDASVDAVVTDPPYSIGFMGRTWDSHQDGNEDAAFAYWFTGFVDGEGCFRVQRHERGTFTCTFALKVRRDERGTLERIQRFFDGAGTIRDGEGGGHASPQSTWAVQDKAGCLRLVEFFDKYQLRAKKRLDYEPWALAVLEWHNMKRGNRWHGKSDWSRMAELKARVEGARQYVDPPWSGHGFQDWTRLWAAECHRVLKPGGHLLSFGGTRQWHRLTAGIEDAGFEIRDSIAWLYGSGFPKSLNVALAIDKAAGATEARGEGINVAGVSASAKFGTAVSAAAGNLKPAYTDAVTPDAQTWAGWGTALKPAHEPIVVARKPLTGTVAANVLAHGTGALNIDATRIGMSDEDRERIANMGGFGRARYDKATTPTYNMNSADNPMPTRDAEPHSAGRWPANVVLDPAAAEELDRQSGTTTAGAAGKKGSSGFVDGYDGDYDVPYGDTGGASRFFYVAKAGSNERPRVAGKGSGRVTGLGGKVRQCNVCETRAIESSAGEPSCGHGDYRWADPTTDVSGTIAHPTVKPLELMRWLVRLVTPPGGVVLEPFAGSGTTAEACVIEGFNCIAIEREADYLPLIVQRLSKPIEPVMF